MKRLLLFVLLFGPALVLSSGMARAEVGAGREEADSSRDSFSRAVDPKRFRTGNIEWDNQELIVSGLTALHKEHLKLMSEVA